MSCEGKTFCPIHGTKYMRRFRVASGSWESYCNGCHAGERAVAQQYKVGVERQDREVGRRMSRVTDRTSTQREARR